MPRKRQGRPSATPPAAALGPRIWPRAVALAVLTLAVFARALSGGFVVDDYTLLAENPAIAAADGLGRIWASRGQLDYFPLTLTSFWLEWRLWKNNPTGYHVTNVLLHLLGAGLLWAVLARLRVAGAWLATLLFAVHPVSVASVAWISERKNTLSFVLFALTTLFFLEAAADEKARRWYALAFIAFVLGLLAKTSGVTLPLVLLGLLWWKNGRLTRADLARTAPFFIASLALGLVTVWFQFHRAMQALPLERSFVERLLHGLASLGLYASKLVLPINLGFVWEPWRAASAAAWTVSAAFVVSMAVAAWRAPPPYRRPVRVALGAYVALLLPVLGFVDTALLHYTPGADHWQYLAMPAPLALLAAGWVKLHDRAPPRWQGPLAALPALALAALAALSWQRAALYRHDEPLWRDAVIKAPRSAYARASLANTVFDQGRREEARQSFVESVRLEPRNPLAPLAHYRLALLDLDQAQGGAAIEHLATALALDARYLEARILITTLLIESDRPADAGPHLQVLLSHSGRSTLLLGRTLARGKNPQRALALLPRFFGTSAEAAARTALAVALIDGGDLPAAEAELARALQREPHRADAHLALAFIASSRGDAARERELLQKAVALDPTLTEAAMRLEVLSKTAR